MGRIFRDKAHSLARSVVWRSFSAKHLTAPIQILVGMLPLNRLAPKSVSKMSLRLIKWGCVVGLPSNQGAHASVRQPCGEEPLVNTDYISSARSRSKFLFMGDYLSGFSNVKLHIKISAPSSLDYVASPP